MKKKNELKAIYFIKAICAIGIIIFHFSCYTEKFEFLPFYKFQNGDWGSVFVVVFFMVSGGLLYYNYSEKIDLKKYYIKRWKAIFPMYYIIYLFFEIGYMIVHKSIFYRGNPMLYIFTILGMDGYLNSIIPTYYILGEWFLGMIILLYILFPVILYFFKKNDKITFIFCLLLYIIFLGKPILIPISFRSIISSLFSFFIGMIMFKYRDNCFNVRNYFVSIIGILILILIKLPLSFDVCVHLFGLFLFVFLFMIGNYVMEKKILYVIFKKIGELSYAIFLLQHITINIALKYFYPVNIVEWLIALLVVIIFILCGANVLYMFTNFLVNKVFYLKKVKNKI